MLAVSVDGLDVIRGNRRVLHSVSLTIPQGKVVGLVGPSGCGKSTLIRSIVGAQIVAGGTIDVLGRPAGASELRSDVAYMTQSSSIYGDLTVTENLKYFSTTLRAPPGDIDRVIAQVDLGDFAHRVVNTLSGGQRNRVSLAAALLGSPKILLLDEPTVGLDPVLRNQLWGLFKRLAGGGVTLLVSSHAMDEAARCDEVLLMREGSLLASGTPADLLRQTGKNDMESAFLALVESAAA
ncbi:ABC-2 type transport system ATP-binding protein [Frankineae bacterium MT45]|nr:ABC-2 type transport system ATP-binding protein [Frankineae bacterium MT45]